MSMSRFLESTSKWQRFRARNDGDLFNGFVKEFSAKLYRRKGIRAVARLFFSRRQPEKWLFLVGCYNSGTTILRRLIDSHPAISAIPHEGVQLTDSFPNLEAGGWRRMMYANRTQWDLDDVDAPNRARRAQADWAVWWGRKATVFLEKSIDNSTRMQWLDQYFPNAYFIAITRNGLCVNEGILRRAKPLDQAAEQVGERYPAEMLANQWNEFDQVIQESCETVDRSLQLRYEDLMDDPVATMTDIFEFLGLSIPSIRLDGDVLSIGEQQHQLINQNAASLARLSPEDEKEMREIMAPAMHRNGY